MKKPKTKKPSARANPLWGGHYAEGPASIMAEINASIDVDKRLYAQDIRASQAHAAMLAKRGIIPKSDGQKIQNGLARVLKEIDNGTFKFSCALEDIHMNVEARLAELIGPAAGRLHTARSRNDQVATDLRLWLRDTLDQMDAEIRALQKALLDQADKNAAMLMPGFTHLQPAQPVTFGHHLLAYAEMLGRDRSRLKDCRARLNECPLGSAALAGTSFPIDRMMTAKALGFAKPMSNSIDAVSARDFALEFLAAAAICGMHLSRLAEEIVIWNSPAFGFVKLPEAFTTGSSIMPQKRNPDAAELVRAKTGRLLGDFNTLFVVMKGLALAYGKDMQEDKEPLFDAADTLRLSLAAMTGMIKNLKADKKAMAAALGKGLVTATDLADYLVRKLNLPFREAHHVTGKIVRLAEQKNLPLEKLSLKDMQKIEPRLTREIFSILDPARAASARRSFGGTAPELVKKAVKDARKRFL
ncbi:MAG TPA: argininosuccinate lyase [Alphaproteobacteria bacterium]|nr:argininosuccinate lyase [Alphaproteobacteria bacterium]